MFLYVDKQEKFSRVDKVLLEKFGDPVHVMTLVLEPGRKLAVTDSDKVMAAIEAQGFYLQLPPAKERYMQSLRQKNTKL